MARTPSPAALGVGNFCTILKRAMFLFLKILPYRAKILLWTAVHFHRPFQERMKAKKEVPQGGRYGFKGFDGLAAAVLMLAWEDLQGKYGAHLQEKARRWWGSDGWCEMVEGLGIDPERLMRIRL